MARTQTLQEMVANLRAEAGHSLSVAQGTNTETTLKYLLKRTQEELWTAFTWPELQTRDQIAMLPGVFVYDYSVNIKFDAIRAVWATTTLSDPASQRWSPVDYGIGEDLKIADGSAAPNQNISSGDPVSRWKASGTSFRVYPTPIIGGWLKFGGNTELQPLIANADSCTLDATVILLFAASELLARAKAEDAANKLQKAQRHLNRLLGNQVSAKNKISTFGTMAPGGYLGWQQTNINLIQQ